MVEQALFVFVSVNRANIPLSLAKTPIYAHNQRV